MKIKYYYDTETCRYKRVETSWLDVVLNAIGFFFLCSICGFAISYAHSRYFPSRAEMDLQKENADLEYAYELAEQQIAEAQGVLSMLQERDDNMYRVIFEQEPIPLEIRKAGTGGSQKYKNLLEGRLSREDMVLGLLNKIDNLKREMYVQTKSYDELAEIASDKTKMLASIPAIQPIPNALNALASGFGMRMHPIYKVPKPHTGCDLAAKMGSPIYVTGDGKVEAVKNHRKKGYGLHVIVDHGYGYKTLYGHMSATDMKRGMTVKRGQQIGEVGSSGTSTAPHLHYEVIKQGRRVDPAYYFHSDLSPEEFELLLQKSARENQSLGGGPVD